ncbi:MAG TPA: AzlC family ABC transporter permease [Microlunatus sp.]|nr:AzlC family ABC transporter permease [Microlunatus sp.]
MSARQRSGGWRTGLRVGATLAVPTAALGVSFGATAAIADWPPGATIVMSALVLSGSAQFAFLTALADGTGLASGVVAGALMNLRFAPMAAASARSLHGGRLQRAFEGQTVVDGSWAPAQRPDGTTDRELMVAATFVQWPAWVAGTAVGVLLAPSADLLHRYGLDVVFPCFFLLLLLDSLRSRPDHRWVAVTALAIAAVGVLLLPAGIALLLSSAATFVALLTRTRS